MVRSLSIQQKAPSQIEKGEANETPDYASGYGSSADPHARCDITGVRAESINSGSGTLCRAE
jgi:hypothetical protein